MKLARVGLLVFAGLSLAVAGSALVATPFYRWSAAPATECIHVGTTNARFTTQPIEWENLPTTAQIGSHLFLNGVDSQTPDFNAPDGTGSATYPAFTSGSASYPFVFTLQLDTLVDDAPIYHSALTATCTGDGATTSVPIHWVPGQTPIYLRWATAPAVSCSTTAGGVQLLFESQPMEWKNLPASAEYEFVSSSNGSEVATGPFSLPTGDGSMDYGPLAENEPDYPVHYAVQLDTKIGSLHVHQSVLVGVCDDDGPGTSAVYDVPEPDAAALALAAFGCLGAARRRRAT